MRVREIMSEVVETVEPTQSAAEAWEIMRRERIRHLVAVNGKAMVGVISQRDLRNIAEKERTFWTINELMSNHVVFATPDTTIKEAANLMRGRAIGCLPVLEKGKLVGMVTVTDLLDLLGRGAFIPRTRPERWTLRDRGPGRRKQHAVQH